MDNTLQLVPEDCDAEGELVHELPREEALVRLYELVQRFASGGRMRCPVQSERDPAGLELPHTFAYGCCRAAVPAA